LHTWEVKDKALQTQGAGMNEDLEGGGMQSMFRILGIGILSAGLTGWVDAAPQQKKQQRQRPRLEERSNRREAANVAYLAREVRKELVTLPYYGVFDWLEGEVRPDGTVYLRGQVIRPTTASDAAGRVKDIEGVTRVVNQIEVLPLSPADDDIRRATLAAIYNANSPLFRYANQVNPPIHIIVKNGNVTLKGVVANTGEANFAQVRANGVPGVFNVRNELRVESASR
jgi:hyperosmotically inducible periplasmic protein